MSSKSALILLAEGNEEMEVIIPTDTLRRAGVNTELFQFIFFKTGWWILLKIQVTLAGLTGKDACNCSRNVKIVPDTDLESAVKQGPYDIIILPGGLGGAQAFCQVRVYTQIYCKLFKKNFQSTAVGALLKEQETAGRKIAAICAAPTVLKTFEIGVGKQLTSHPSVEQEITAAGKHTYLKDRVVVDGKKTISVLTKLGYVYYFDSRAINHKPRTGNCLWIFYSYCWAIIREGWGW